MNDLKHGEFYKKTFYNIVLAAFAIVGSICTFSSYTYTLEIDMKAYIMVGIALAIIFCAFFSFDKIRKYAIMVFLGIFLILVIKNYRSIIEGFIVWIENFRICAKASHYTLPFHKFDVDDIKNTDYCLDVFLLTLEYLVACLVCFQLSKRKGLVSGIIIVLLLSIMGIFVDLKPDLLFFGMALAYIFAVVSIMLSSKIPVNKQREQAFKIAIFLFSFSIVIGLVVPSNVSIRNSYTLKLKNFFENGISSWLAETMPKVVKGGIDHGNLMNYKQGKSYDGKTDLIVTIPYDSKNVYLRSYTGQMYIDKKWNNDNLLEYPFDTYNPEFLNGYSVANLLENQEYYGEHEEDLASTIYNSNIIIKKTFDTEDEVFVPYFSVPGETITVFSDKEMEKLMKSESYEIQTYVLNENDYLRNYKDLSEITSSIWKNLLVSTDSSEFYYVYDEIYDYSLYVEEMYSTYPALIRDYAKKRYGEKKIETYSDIENLVATIKEDFNENFMYSLELRDPEDADPILFFLERSHEGFCMHFATAATLILRSYGIPARYAEGYMIRPNDKRWGTVSGYCTYLNGEKAYNMTRVNVSDKLAHAWVEIYYEGLGWVPYEFTPGYTEDEVIKPKPTLPENITMPSRSVNTETKTREETTVSERQITKHVENENEEEKFNPYWLILTLVEVVLISIVVIIHLVSVAQHKKLFEKNGQVDKKRAVKLYRALDKMLYYMKYDKKSDMSYMEFAQYLKEKCPYANTVDTKVIMDLLTQATFSKEQMVTDEKLISDAIDSIIKLSHNMYESIGLLQKIRFRYIINIYY